VSIRNLVSRKTVYFLPDDNLVGEVIVPALGASNSYDIMTAFFSSKSFKEISLGLAKFLESSDGKIRLIISPFLSKDDKNALKDGLETPSKILEENFKNIIRESQSLDRAIVSKTLECLAYLISNNRLELKFALVKSGDLLHAKISIIKDEFDTLVIHGSTNFTSSGLVRNFENASLVKSWDETHRENIYSFVKKFDDAWLNKENSLEIYDLSEGLRKKIIKEWEPSERPKYESLKEISRENNDESSIEVVIKDKQQFSVPGHIDCWAGDYKHQGVAIDAWVKNNYQGIFEMCTGAGKTIASLVATNKLFIEKEQLLVFISVPYKPLLNQWVAECNKFGLSTTGLIKMNRSKKKDKFYNIKRKLEYGTSKIEVIVGTINSLVDEEFVEILKGIKVKKLLIGDEVHNLGAEGFTSNLPTYFDFRLGLSATVVRQYDEVGTESILEFFGDVVAKYELKDAIGKCLVNYDYNVYPVKLTDEESFRWITLTEKLRKLGWMEEKESEGSSNIIDSLRRQRRLIVEQATNKFQIFKASFLNNYSKDLKHTLVYTSDKGNDQLQTVNHFLEETGVIYHQVTNEETSSGISVSILDSFANGNLLQVLTAMRVLDEGVNIPEIANAYILASTTVKRQWVQRRGRVLRQCERTNKKKAIIHDFVIVPPNDEIFSALQNYEFERIREFSILSSNPRLENGGMTFLNKYRY